ncbi:MAG: DNA topoisomerase IB [Burkholderiales bacterium]|nr:DNA topoisomerase IB [Burkholderiales bacterium]
MRPAPSGGLRYSRDGEKGYVRKPGPKGFEYHDAKGERVTDEETLERIKSLAIPPAWIDVWICGDERGHLQATGRDARGRKQYRYHPRWRELRDADKFDHLMEFARALPRIRRQVRADMALAGLPRRKVLALLVQLLESTSIRIGNERYAEENDSFGLTTMRNRHVKVSGARVEFQFRGKSGKFHRIAVDDPQLARVIRRCRDLPGQELFQYLDDSGEVQSIGSSDVNGYLKEIGGYSEISTKDFRTWKGSVYVASMLRGRVRREERVGITHVAAAVRAASQQLGNTPAICRKSYVHPRVLDPKTWQVAQRRAGRPPRGLRAEEAAFLTLIRPLREASRTPRPRRPNPSASQRASFPTP